MTDEIHLAKLGSKTWKLNFFHFSINFLTQKTISHRDGSRGIIVRNRVLYKKSSGMTIVKCSTGEINCLKLERKFVTPLTCDPPQQKIFIFLKWPESCEKPLGLAKFKKKFCHLLPNNVTPPTYFRQKKFFLRIRWNVQKHHLVGKNSTKKFFPLWVGTI